MNNIVNGAVKQIKTAVKQVDEVSAENNRNFNDLKTETGKFKVETGNEKKIVLIVDDDATDLTMVSGMLEEDYEVVTAGSGQEALNLFFQGLVPHVIMLDLIMPGMDGWDTFERIRKIGNLHFVPITIYTASDNPNDKTHAQQIGAVDYINKPCKKENLSASIEAIVTGAAVK